MPILRDPWPDVMPLLVGGSLGDDLGVPLTFTTQGQLVPQPLAEPLMLSGQNSRFALPVLALYGARLDESYTSDPMPPGVAEVTLLNAPSLVSLPEPTVPISTLPIRQKYVVVDPGGNYGPATIIMNDLGHPVGIEGQVAFMIAPLYLVQQTQALRLEFPQSTARFAISGITKDSTGAALASCRVMAMETGRMAMDGPNDQMSNVGEVLSDGSGNYTLPVPTNTGYQLTAYKPGSPDVAGITRNDVAPSQVG